MHRVERGFGEEAASRGVRKGRISARQAAHSAAGPAGGLSAPLPAFAKKKKKKKKIIF
jgi:hypothetical protein